MKSRTDSVTLLAPQVYGSDGGVPAYSRRILEILDLYGVAEGLRLDCFSLHDTAADPGRHVRQPALRSFHGAGGSKGRFARDFCRSALASRPRLAVVAHIGLLPLAWASARAGLLQRYVLVLHGVEAWKRVDALDRIAARGAHRIVSTTRHTADVFARLNGVDPARTCVVPLALEPGPDPGAAPPRTGAPDLRVLTVGRLAAAERYKGVDTLIAAASFARRRGHAVSVDVIGSGDDMARLRDLASALDVAERIRFRGNVSDDELRLAYRECDVFAMPSKGEGFGIVFLEAMRAGRPCIGGNHGGVPEVIQHGVDGFLVEHGATAQLAESLILLKTDPDLRARMGRNAHRSFVAKYQFDRMQAGWFEALTEARKKAIPCAA